MIYSNKEDDEESLHNDGNDYDDFIANLKDCNDYNYDDDRVLVVVVDDDDDDNNNSVIASRHATYDKFYDVTSFPCVRCAVPRTSLGSIQLGHGSTRSHTRGSKQARR